MIDTSFTPLLPYLQQVDVPTLWFADENALSVLQQLSASQHLHIMTNRIDIHELACNKGFDCTFSDFAIEDLIPDILSSIQRVIYRVSKEKPLTHHLLNQACQLLPHSGELVISGQKQEGTKSYADKIVKVLGGQGKLKKTGNTYSGCFTCLGTDTQLDSKNYSIIREIHHRNSAIPFYSKPGVFGWDKIDSGTELLLENIANILNSKAIKPKSILDLGCGYGWIFLNLPQALPNSLLEAEHNLSVVATDNNAAALLCAQKNAEQSQLDILVTGSDCATNIDQLFDLILCNPPFHQGFSHDKRLTEKFLTQTAKHLSPEGLAIFVVNEFIKLPIDHLSKAYQLDEICRQSGYKILTLNQ